MIDSLRRFYRPTFLSLLMLAAASGAAAQRLTSSDDGIRRGDAARTDPDFRRVISCTVRREPTRSRNLVNSIPESNNADRIISCYLRPVGGIGFSWNLLRGGIAEYIYHGAFPTGLPPAPASAPSETAIAWTRPRMSEGHVTDSESLHAVARCVVLRNSATVSALLSSAPFSAGELVGMQSIQADLAACITAGVRFIASRQSLRGLLAEEALHYGEALANGFRADLPGETPSR